MNDRTQWDDPRGERGDSNYSQGGQGRSSQRWQQQQQDWNGPGRQQGAWHDEDQRRSGSYRGNEWRGERDWGSPGYGYSGTQAQPQQREWRSSSQDRDIGTPAGRYGGSEFDQGDYGYAERAWGGSSDRYGARPTSSGSMHRDEMGETTRMRQDRQMRERDVADRDVGARRGQDWYSQDSGQPGSQSFAAGYGMSSGANYDQWGGPEQRRGTGQSWGHSGGSNPTFGRGYGPDYGREGGSGRSGGGGQERGFFERAGDEIASWFGDEDAARRREQDYRGHGPSDYTRSDERIREDVNDRLTDDPRLDARRISVSVHEGEVTLAGTVGSRDAKRRAEDCIDRISGVKHVQNNLRVEERGREGSESWSVGSSTGYTGASTASAGSSGTGSSTTTPTGTSGTATSGSSGSTTMGSGSAGATGSSTSSPGTTGTGGGTASSTGSTGSAGSSSSKT